MKLVGVGDNVADYYVDQQTVYPGGSTYNVTVWTARLGGEAAYVGPMGDNPAGRYLYKILEQEGVDTSHIEIKQGKNAYSRIAVEDGEGKIRAVDKGVYTGVDLGKAKLQFIANYNYLHSTMYSYTEDYLEKFKKLGLTISFDYSFKTNEDYIKQTLPFIDIAFFTGEGRAVPPQEFLEWLSSLGLKCGVITLGQQGAMACYGGRVFFQPASRVDTVDGLGAGDAFIARFLWGWAEGIDIPRLLEQAVSYAADSCSYYGAVGHGQKMSPSEIY